MRALKIPKSISVPLILFCLLIPYLFGFTISGSTKKGLVGVGQSKKVAVLVVRVGNLQAFSPMTQISLKTDYSVRTPKLGTDVFIDNEERLAESVPTYPKYTGCTQGYMIEYFKNITAEVFEGIKMCFEQKFYEVVDFKQLSNSWDKPYSEMTVKEIITSLSDKVDFLFVFHYMDLGNSSINSKIYKVKAKNSGFTSTVFAYTLFDVVKQKKVFSYSPMIGFAVTPSIIYNPEIMDNPDLRKRIVINCDNDSFDKTYKLSHDFTDSELIKIFTDIIIHGFQCPAKRFIECYDDCKYYDLKSLISQIP